MSYILEALKKAQAERQLGSAPTIHAPAAAPASAAQAARTPLVAGIAVGALLAATGLFVWHSQPARVHEATPSAASIAAVTPPVAAPAAAGKPAAPRVALVGQADPPARPAAQAAAESRAAAPVVAKAVVPAPAAVAKAAVPEAPAAPRTPAPVHPAPALPASAAPAAAPAQQVAAAAPPASADESLGGLNTVPEPVRAGIPKVAFGGYMYSPNPSDRLILVDNILRHEGEEVGPGLVLEKLLPKGAVMNYRGYRYRVPF